MRLGWRTKASGCVDEIPTFQVLERDPIRRAIPGSIEQQEFDYTRHGTVNMLLFLIVHTGLMEAVFLEQNDHDHYLPELELFHKHHRELKGVFLVQDGGPSHVAAETQRYFAKSHGWWKSRYTPANASWLNQAEILIHSFKHYYLKRDSWKTPPSKVRPPGRVAFSLPSTSGDIGCQGGAPRAVDSYYSPDQRKTRRPPASEP